MKLHLQTTVFTLLAAGKSQREIARITKVDRKTIRALEQRFIIEKANSPGVSTVAGRQITPPRPPQQNRHLSRPGGPVRIQGQLQQRQALHGHAGSTDPAQFDRLEFAPGEEVQVDYGEGAPTRVPSSDRYRKPRLFIMTLRYTRRCFRRVVWRSSQ